jgi:hypothetical protein
LAFRFEHFALVSLADSLHRLARTAAAARRLATGRGKNFLSLDSKAYHGK